MQTRERKPALIQRNIMTQQPKYVVFSLDPNKPTLTASQHLSFA
jgi:hypothetical protein